MFVTINVKYPVKLSLKCVSFTQRNELRHLFKGTHIQLLGQMRRMRMPFIRRDEVSSICMSHYC